MDTRIKATVASAMYDMVHVNANGYFDFETKTVMLNSRYEMPIDGLGTYSLHGDECINSVKFALSNGVRLINTASTSSRPQ